jgi:hypothetical protein
MSNWQDCVLSYFDLIGITEMITTDRSRATNLMRELHVLVRYRIISGMIAHSHAYTWNDSATFLSFINNDGDYEKTMRELNTLKPIVDSIYPSYVICMKGQAIPEPACNYGPEMTERNSDDPRFVYIKASSYAFANCYRVEEKLKDCEMDWYVDNRIVSKIPSFPKCKQHVVKMFPDDEERNIHVLKGLIWKQPQRLDAVNRP